MKKEFKLERLKNTLEKEGGRELVQKICDLADSLETARSTHRKVAIEMFGLYNQYYNAHESNYMCSTCNVRVLKGLLEVRDLYRATKAKKNKSKKNVIKEKTTSA